MSHKKTPILILYAKGGRNSYPSLYPLTSLSWNWYQGFGNMLVSLRSSNLINQRGKGQSKTIIQMSGYLKLLNLEANFSERQHSKVVKISDSGSRMPGLETLLHWILAVSPWARYSFTLCFNFLICKIRIMIGSVS